MNVLSAQQPSANPIASLPAEIRPAIYCLAVLSEPVVVRKLWRARDRSAALYVRLLTRGAHNLADVRLFRIDVVGFTIDIQRRPKLAAAAIAAHPRAIELSLFDRRESAR